MSRVFQTDPYPGQPKILFVGPAESTHTHAWINLLEGEPVNVRLFALPSGFPPAEWPVRTYVTALRYARLNPATRERMSLWVGVQRLLQKSAQTLRGGATPPEQTWLQEERWLAEIIRRWQPDIIHTLGMDPAAAFYLRARERHGLHGIGTWVLQVRGGSDLALRHLDPEAIPAITHLLASCDQILTDNEPNFAIAGRLGIPRERFASIAPVPGTGGIDIEAITRTWQGPPSQRRVILWPKAYECPWSKALPVLEALQLCWDAIQPCEIHLLAMAPDVRMWYWTLPEAMRAHCHLAERISRAEVLALMARARVLLIPSLVDGTPNSMFEGMAAGAFPIVSPLETIRPLVEDGRHVLFARNLYPDEIATALTRAMTDDALVDAAAETNLGVVRQRADRAAIRVRVRNFYQQLASKRPGT